MKSKSIKGHSTSEIKAALAVRQKINNLPESKNLDGFTPKVSIGIKSGEMISGNISSASLKRLDYTVIGDTVNTAARLQDAAGENQIIISESCYNKVKESFVCKSIGEITMKNKSKPLAVYEVVE